MSAAPKRPARAAAAASGLLAPRWAKVSRTRLIRREVRESLAPGAVELLLEHAEVVVEGGHEITPAPGGDAGRGAGQVFATVMITIDLARSASRFREPADAATAERVAELMRDAPTLLARLVELTRPRLAQLAGVAPETLEISVQPQLRAEGVRVLIDVDAVGWPRKRRRS